MLALFTSALLLCSASLVVAAPGARNHTLSRREDWVRAGKGTVYSQDGSAGSCGNWHDDYDHIVALGHYWMKHDYQAEPCGRQIRVKNVGCDYEGIDGEGNEIVVTVQDSCDSCDKNHLDLSIGAWNELTDDSEWGELNIEWNWL
ncbi:RlpA-like double-psi beta-barrel-protein domain-containing protein-containing protein [Podospora appendiculata]|uniref:RlpA-like double-psi beta-barrel-protein domain-containing protein-containing protein n=1 Tax=Podospora appendiculata TaxID=314037 RepID=A0AAE0XJS2_9PEZI|nr:RlpA-like double-psi beta-barrel-protein domain-containing protein-containing protein [Podospora appendiculata]